MKGDDIVWRLEPNQSARQVQQKAVRLIPRSFAGVYRDRSKWIVLVDELCSDSSLIPVQVFVGKYDSEMEALKAYDKVSFH